MGSNSLRQRLTGNFTLVLAVAAILMAFGGRGAPEGEARSLFEPALSLVRDGTPKIAKVGAPAGTARIWGENSLASSVVHLPGALLVQLGTKIAPNSTHGLTVLGSRLGSAVLSGVLALQLFGLALVLGLSRPVARAGAVLVVFATSIAVLGRTPLYHILHTVLFTGAFASAVALARSPDARTARNLGLWFAALLTVAFGFVLILPGLLAITLWYGSRGGASVPKIGWAFAWPVGLGLLVAGLDSWLRLGSSTAVIAAMWSVPMKQGVFAGLWSIFFSPGKSVLLYNLPLVLSCFGVRPMLRRGHGHILLVTAVFVAPVLLYLAKNPFWSGGWGWGPRHLLFAVPTLLLPALCFMEDLAELFRQRRWRSLLLPGSVVVIFIGSGLGVQVLGSSLAPENYLRISSIVRLQWLGRPNRFGAFAGPIEGGCSPCFEDEYVTAYLPPFQPIEGHMWLATHLWAGDDHAAAQLTGPWHRETILDFNIKPEYEQARFDWWVLDHLRSPRSIVMALLLFGSFLSLAAFSARMWIRSTVSGDRSLVS